MMREPADSHHGQGQEEDSHHGQAGRRRTGTHASPSAGNSPAWRVSSRCAGNGTCVEISEIGPGQVGVRDGKQGDASPVLLFGRAEWQQFIDGIRAGELS